MAWRDRVIRNASTEANGNSNSGGRKGKGKKKDSLNAVTIQTTALHTLSALYLVWSAETRTAWDAHAGLPLSIEAPRDALTQKIYNHTTRRLRCDGRIIAILGLLLGAWKAHLASGLASVPDGGGPSLYSDVRILKVCREACAENSENRDSDGKNERGEERMIQKLLKESEVLTGNYKEDACILGDFSTTLSRAVMSRKRVERNENQVTALVATGDTNPPPSARSRPPVFFTRPESLPAQILNTRRAQIQHAWNKVARDAGAAGVEFVNEVDEEEVPPGINVLFPYLERGYLFDIGIAETSPLVGCRCDAMVGCDEAEASQCSCQAVAEGGSAYTSQGLFKFNTDSEIIECNNVSDSLFRQR
ncbi:hypothetical protein C8F04DRAFT_541257 [Mycena alexandri]|uniref:Pre-SET domain-containing protein n=1 Tax=Mycena alexandri TaxID=1745969 RepID=A0AAD6SW77_9AGAR|nr:hypothetical protein C8F04DRAFT_541257 [Mycena alexandri]